jgi:hypothetical protein
MRGAIEDIAIEIKAGEIETRGETWGDITVRTVDIPAGADFRPLLAGLPGDRCECPHWGYFLRGSLTVRYADGTEEVTRAGDLYYWPGGHTAWTDEGAVFVEFSPAVEIAPVLEHLGKQFA